MICSLVISYNRSGLNDLYRTTHMGNDYKAFLFGLSEAHVLRLDPDTLSAAIEATLQKMKATDPLIDKITMVDIINSIYIVDTLQSDG